MQASGFLTALSQTPNVLTMRVVPGGPGTHLPRTPQPAQSYGATHLTGVWSRELPCSRSGALRSQNSMVVETWIEMLREKLKHISSLLSLNASVNIFLGAWTYSVHYLVG
jgi:hypothetical protein